MTADQSDHNDADEGSQRSPFVDPDGLSIQIAQKLAEPKPEKQVPAPRLSIAHLFLWTTLSAVIMAIWRNFFRPEADLDVPGTPALEIAFWCIMSAVYGLQATGLYVEVARWRRHGRFPLQPGEWLLVAYGTINVVWIAAVGLNNLVASERPDAVYIFGGIVAIVALVTIIVAAVKIGAWSAWRWMLLSSLLAPIISALSQDNTGDYVVHTLQAALWLTAVVRDRAHWPERNWLHWTGAFTFFLILAIFFVFDVLWRIAEAVA